MLLAESVAQSPAATACVVTVIFPVVVNPKNFASLSKPVDLRVTVLVPVLTENAAAAALLMTILAVEVTFVPVALMRGVIKPHFKLSLESSFQFECASYTMPGDVRDV